MGAWDSTIAALDAAIAAAVADGSWRVQAVSIGDQTTTLRSLDEAIALRAKLAGMNGASGASRTRYGAFRKGV